LLGDLLALRWLVLDPFAELDPAVPDERFRIISGQFERAIPRHNETLAREGLY
jgi:hypothetical protein